MAVILIVDDSPTSRQLLREVLAPRDHQVFEACDGEQALLPLKSSSD